MKKKLLVIVLIILALHAPVAFSQLGESDVKVFGYFQTAFDHDDATSGRSTVPSNSFYLQQLNLMFSDEFTPTLNAFVNFEVTNTYSSSKNWGSFSLQEAWVKYHVSTEVNVKAGLLIPVFNNLNEIKNRTPLLPYIFRPFVYEASVSDIFPVNELVPEQAFLQAYGFVPVGEAKLDYAVYVGNGSDYVNASTGNYLSRGLDTTLFKMVGGRVGVRDGTFKAGVSGTADKEDGTMIGLGPVQRYRIGADLSFEVSGLSGEFEFITVEHPMTQEQSMTLAGLAKMVPSLGPSLDKFFYYGLLNYDFNDKIFGYAGYNYLKDRSLASLDYGLEAYTFGGGYRPHNRVVIKAQYILFDLRDNPLAKFHENHYMLALSVFF